MAARIAFLITHLPQRVPYTCKPLKSVDLPSEGGQHPGRAAAFTGWMVVEGCCLQDQIHQFIRDLRRLPSLRKVCNQVNL
jgi:hypothetical protein